MEIFIEVSGRCCIVFTLWNCVGLNVMRFEILKLWSNYSLLVLFLCHDNGPLSVSSERIKTSFSDSECDDVST